jgi:hypothetical protein
MDITGDHYVKLHKPDECKYLHVKSKNVVLMDIENRTVVTRGLKKYRESVKERLINGY